MRTVHGEGPAQRRPMVVVIAGPTAVGKSQLAHELAARLNGEIISADSVQVYRGLDIGANKPSALERSLIPYHLVDILEPSKDAFSAGSFYELARAATTAILGRQRVPIVVGGTMMYLRWYVLGKPATTAPTPEITRAVLAELALDEWDWDRCLARLAAHDPERAAMLHRNDWYRLRRALEVVKSTGGIGIGGLPLRGGAPCSRRATAAPLSATHMAAGPSSSSAWTDTAPAAKITTKAPDLDVDFRCYFLSLPRVELNRRIDARCEDMVWRGLLLETAGLLRGPWAAIETGTGPEAGLDAETSKALSAFRAIGYRQAIEYLQHGERTPAGLRAFLAKFMQASRQYARRQIQWFRSETLFRWRAADQPDLVDRIENELQRVSPVDAHDDAEDARLRMESHREAKQMKRYQSCLQIFHDDSRAWQVLRALDPSRPSDPGVHAPPSLPTS
jgi:tRNA dimethylallyltransferase